MTTLCSPPNRHKSKPISTINHKPNLHKNSVSQILTQSRFALFCLPKFVPYVYDIKSKKKPHFSCFCGFLALILPSVIQ